MANEEVKSGLWQIIKSYVPKPIILIILLYIGVVAGGIAIYNTVTGNDKLDEEFIKTATSVFIISFIIITILFLLLCTFLIFIKVKKHRIPEGNIEASIVKQNDDARDGKFNDLNKSVKHTYWVLGISLTSIVNREPVLKEMAEKNVKIRICMMNPNIAVENLCLSSIEKNTCLLEDLVEEIKNGLVEKKNIKEKAACKKECKSLLSLYNVLIDVVHFNKYFDTVTDYRGIIAQSYKDLTRIKNSITQKCGEDSFELKTSNSFIPISMTITDADSEDGKMIVEFHLPFTQFKALFEIHKTNNKDLFDVFVGFYKKIMEEDE